MDKTLHVKHDEWAVPAKKTKARTRIKRARTKAKRQLAKKIMREDL